MEAPKRGNRGETRTFTLAKDGFHAKTQRGQRRKEEPEMKLGPSTLPSTAFFFASLPPLRLCVKPSFSRLATGSSLFPVGPQAVRTPRICLARAVCV